MDVNGWPRYRTVKKKTRKPKSNSTLKRQLWKSAFSEGVRHFERQFQVDGDVARNRSMDRWIGEWCSYNLPLEIFIQRNFVANLFSREVEIYWHKLRYRVFVPPFGGLRGNVHGSSMARWKARGRLPVGDSWTFFASYHGWALWADIGRNCAVLKGVGHFERKFQGKGASPTNDFWHRKVESLSYRMVKKNCRKVQPPE